MANPEHVSLVRKGTAALREWRKKHKGVWLDLEGADLRGIDLRWAAIYRAIMNGCNLVDARFDYATLDSMAMSHVDMRAAKFQGATLSNLHVLEGNCQRCIFVDSQLYGCILFKSDFQGASFLYGHLQTTSVPESLFNGAFFGGTSFGNVDLTLARGLEEAEHRAPSSLGIDTLLRNGHKLPQSFLRGCGVPQLIVEMLPSLVGALSPIQFYSCFISYSSKDDEFARRLHGRMEQEKLRVWFAPEDMKAGLKMHDQIEEAIRFHDKLLLVLSQASMESEWVKTEIRRARARELREKRQVLFPIRLVGMNAIKAWSAFDADSGKDMAAEIREYHIPDFSGWKDNDSFEKGFAKLLADLKKSAEPRVVVPGA